MLVVRLKQAYSLSLYKKHLYKSTDKFHRQKVDCVSPLCCQMVNNFVCWNTPLLLETHGALTFFVTGYIASVEILIIANFCVWVASAKLAIIGMTEGMSRDRILVGFLCSGFFWGTVVEVLSFHWHKYFGHWLRSEGSQVIHHHLLLT